MNNVIQRKITSLTLMTIMLAGGVAIGFPGMEPAAAAGDKLYVSAENGNFAGIQVIEIIVSDPNRSDITEEQGIPNVEINGDDVLMTQANNGNWFAYVANQNAIDTYEDEQGDDSITVIYGNVTSSTILSGSDAESIVYDVTDFLDGYLTEDGETNAYLTEVDWPFIQTYDITDESTVTITLGSGSTAESAVMDYDDVGGDISLDRQYYPEGGYIFIDLDDGLLNLSPVADDYWSFEADGTANYFIGDAATPEIRYTGIDSDHWTAIGFGDGPFTYDLDSGDGVYELSNTSIYTTNGTSFETGTTVVLFRENGDVFVNYDSDDVSNLKVTADAKTGSLTYDDSHSIIYDTFSGAISFLTGVDEWLSGVELGIELVDEDKNLNTRSGDDLSTLDGEVPYISIGSPLHLDDMTVTQNTTTSFSWTNGTNSNVFDTTMNSTSYTIEVTGTWPYIAHSNSAYVFSYVNYDFTELGGTSGTFYMGSEDNSINDASPSDVTWSTNASEDEFTAVMTGLTKSSTGQVYFDVLSFGQEGALTLADGEIEEDVDRVNDAFYRFDLEETDSNTATYEGTVEYIMINQLNVFDTDTYDNIATSGDSIVIIVNESEDITVSYNDSDSTGNDDTISVVEEANTHSGVITIDSTSYSSGNTITVTLNDVDLNTDSGTIQVYEVNSVENWVGDGDVWLSQLSINGVQYDGACDTDLAFNATGFTLVETGSSTGIFTGSILLPANYCSSATVSATTNGLDIDFSYQDYSDASGEPNESSDSASIRSNTGSVSLDRTVYPVPFNTFATYDGDEDALTGGNVTITIAVNDPDSNLSASGEDTMNTDTLQLKIARGSVTQWITLPSGQELIETSPESGIFEVDVIIPQDESYLNLTNGTGLIYQGDIITVTYTDPSDASGNANTVTDSATFDLRNAVLQSDKSVYIIGSDAIITLIEPDLNLDSATAETWSLDLINWDSDAGAANLSDDGFSASTSGLRETGDNTGIFQIVIEIPRQIGTDNIERGEEITLEYQDNGPAGADYIGTTSEDVSVTLYTSNFGATIELDQKVYTWTDKVYITIVAPDHNFNTEAIDEIGTDSDGEVTISTRGDSLTLYKLVETGTDTGIFTGEIILTGFDHKADGVSDHVATATSAASSGPTDGFLEASDDDGLTVSFEFSDGEVVLGSSLIRWNIGEVQWLEASYAATASGVIRVIDSDMNLNPESVDSFNIDIWSDTAAGGIALRVTETNEATGIFEGTVFFTVDSASSGSRLAVSEGDTVIASYEDNTLPNPYSTADELDITATTLIGSVTPPLERAPAANLRTVDAFGNSLDAVSVGQQVQISADLINNQDRDQDFAYLVQIQSDEGVTVSLAWITGSFGSGQSFSPALSWIPTSSGTYTATAFVWESIDNPTALSPPVVTTINVS